MKTITVDSCSTHETPCRELAVGHYVWFPKTMVLMDKKREGPWRIVRVWNWDSDSRQLRLESLDGKKRHLSECVRKDVVFYRVET